MRIEGLATRMPRDIQIHDGLAPHFSEAAAHLYDEAFGAKLRVAIPSRADRLFILERTFHHDLAISAVCEGRLVGLAGFHSESGSFTDGITLRQLCRRLGLLGGFKAAMIMLLLERRPAPGELLMDGIVVNAEFRGRGIGSLLLNRLKELAIARRLKSIRLDVINTNPGARRLYERSGFERAREHRHPIVGRLFGFEASTTMTWRNPEHSDGNQPSSQALL